MTALKHSGLAKLAEELGELQQIVGKMLQFPELQNDSISQHPSGYNLRDRMEDEIGDVCAACRYVSDELKLNATKMFQREYAKVLLFNSWSNES